jgi:multiple sugar transport system ATP-binding protein
VAIGRAIVREPQLFLFDEPLSNLDAELRVQTRLEIARLHRQLDATIIYVTHDQVEAMTLGDKIVVMHEGRVQQAGTPLELYQHPCNRFVATFIGSPKMNLLPGTVQEAGAAEVLVTLAGGAKVRVAVDGTGLAAGQAVQVGLRCEHARPAGAGEALEGTVSMVEHLGEANNIYVALAGGEEIVIRGDGGEAVRMGATIRFFVDPGSFHLFDAAGRACRRLRPGNLVSSRTAAA